MNKLVLFDIDGTLIFTGGAGTKSMNLAFQECLGISDALEGISMAGKTDVQIIKDGLRANGLSSDDGDLDPIITRYLNFLGKEINNPRCEIKPGVMEVLELLKGQGAAIGLLTGNLEIGARIKLRAFGIHEYFIDGAFGSDNEDRDMLLPIALKRFSEKGLRFAPEDCVIVGDTPRDVQCAKVHGARCIAVATGPYSRLDLLDTDADIVFDSLEDTAACMKFISKG